ncbi:ATP-binding cassette domain-containing protein [Nonomuraea sp. NPDC004354]
MGDILHGGARTTFKTPTGGTSSIHGAVSAVRVEELHKTYGKVTALAGVTLEIADGEFVAMMGPSGSGKSTLLGRPAPAGRGIDTGGVQDFPHCEAAIG